jgi:hypothetical protein
MELVPRVAPPIQHCYPHNSTQHRCDAMHPKIHACKRRVHCTCAAAHCIIDSCHGAPVSEDSVRASSPNPHPAAHACMH